MKSFRSEIENPVVERDILELEQKIFAYKNKKIDEEKFRSLRLARGVYGQRQVGVQMIRIKLPLGKFTAQQLIRMADVAQEYASGNLHLTTRQDIQLHYVSLEQTPELWAALEKDKITLREACGNTLRNVTASIFAGIDPQEPFDITPYAYCFYTYFLRNPICQDMGRKFKVSFSSSEADQGISFIHDLGFIPLIKNKQNGFKVLLGGGIGSQPMAAHIIYEFLPSDQLIPFSEAVIRVFDRYGERNKRNKARLKYLVKELGINAFFELVNKERKALPYQKYPITFKERLLKKSNPKTMDDSFVKDIIYEDWKKTNVFIQKQKGLFAVGIPIKVGDIPADQARALAQIIRLYTGDDSRVSCNQSLLLRDIQEGNIPKLYRALKRIDLAQIGFHKINDIVACPGTDTCNLGISSSMGLAKVLQEMIQNEFYALIKTTQLKIKISGCMNACGQHTIANIGFQGMTLKSEDQVTPATQLLLGGENLGNGKGRFADKILKVPAKRTPKVLKWILNDFKKEKRLVEDFLAYYDRKGKDYFYQNLKHFSNSDNLKPADFIDWGNDEIYQKAIGIGECAGVTIDLVQTLLFDAKEANENSLVALKEKRFSDAIYHAYNGRIRAAKAALTKTPAKINSHASIIENFDQYYPDFFMDFPKNFKESNSEIQYQHPTESFAVYFSDQSCHILDWIQKKTYVKAI